MRTLYFLDIDGTIADHTKRAIKAGTCPNRDHLEEYKTWVTTINSGMEHDVPVSGMQDLANLLNQAGCLFYLTNRGDQHRQLTETWLYKHKFPAAPVIMRSPTSWNVGDGEYKESKIRQVLDKLPIHYSVVMIDDDPRGEIQKMCINNEWTFLRCFGKS